MLYLYVVTKYNVYNILCEYDLMIMYELETICCHDYLGLTGKTDTRCDQLDVFVNFLVVCLGILDFGIFLFVLYYIKLIEGFCSPIKF